MIGSILLFIALFAACKCLDETKPHFHQGTLPPYDGTLLQLPEFSDLELKMLDRGEPVSIGSER